MHFEVTWVYCVENNKVTLGLLLLLLLSANSINVQANDLMHALKSGEYGGSLRVRYESVEDDKTTLTDNEADALTARLTLHYTSGDFYKTFFHVELEHITAIIDDGQYNDGTNRRRTLPAIIDPDGTNINQAYLGLKLVDDMVIKAGRQIITPRKDPFHRFLGKVLWRQNWSTYDAITITNTSLPNTTILAGYIWNNNFINELDRDLQAPIFNIKYKGFQYVKLEGYYYDLNFTSRDQTGLGTETVGGRASGVYPINEMTKLIYAGEYASQSESDDAPTPYNADYHLIEGGFKFNFKDSFVHSLMAKASYEVLEGDSSAGIAFRTPLATNHAYQGWADNFLVTPATGIEDTYFTVVATGAWDTKLILSYHMLEAETASFDYGDEMDIWFTKTFHKKYTLGLKYADYNASSDAGNTKATDLSKFWVYFALKF